MKSARFTWTDDCEQIFQKLKTTLTSPPILHKPDTSQPLLVYITATDYTVSAVLVQEVEDTQHLVYFVSRTLQDPETRYQMVEKTSPILGPRSTPPTPIFPKPHYNRQDRLPNPKNITKAGSSRMHVIMGRGTVRIQHPL